MVYGAIDLHKRYSQIRVIDETGQVLRDQRVATNRDRLVAIFAGYGVIRILLESATESEWVAAALEAAGYDVVVADPNFGPMYGDLQRKVKTDKRDAAALAEANRRGWYRRAFRRSAAQRQQQQRLRTRRQLVQARTGMVSLLRALLRQNGYRLTSAKGARLGECLAALQLPSALAVPITPLQDMITALGDTIRALDRSLAEATRDDAVVRRLQTIPGVGPIVAMSFRAFVDRADRFADAGQVSAAVGLVPREDSSADRRHRGHISKAGPRELRSLLVQAAWACWHSQCRAGQSLRAWTDQLAARRGKRIAVVALARRLSRIADAVWRDETSFAMPAATA
jgi:transposase